HVESGRMRLLASVGPRRWPAAPDLPTLREAGYDVAIESWVGVAAPKGMPAEVMARLQAALRRVAADPGTTEEFDKLGIDSSPLSGEAFGEKMQATFVEAAPIMKQL